MSTEKAEVRVRLVATQEGDAVVSKMAESLKDLAGATKAVNQSMQHQGAIAEHTGKKHEHAWANTASSMTGGIIKAELFLKAFEKVHEKAKEFYEYVTEKAPEHAAETEDSIKALGGVLTMVDAGHLGWERINDAARIYHNQLTMTGVKTGVLEDDMRAAFDKIAERSGKPVEKVQELTEQMAMAAKIVPGGMKALGAGFAQLEMGVARVNNPVVQLIANTNTLKGSAADVAKQLHKMSPEKQMELAEKAVAKMAEKAKDIPLTFQQVKQGMATVKDDLSDAFGKPVEEAMTRILNNNLKRILKNFNEIDSVMGHAGDIFGDMLEMADGIKQSIIDAFVGPGGSFAESVKGAFDWAKEKFEWIYDHREGIAKAIKWAADVIKETFTWVFEKAERMYHWIDNHINGGGNENGEDLKKGDRKAMVESQKEDLEKLFKNPNASQKEISAGWKRLAGFGDEAQRFGDMTSEEVDSIVESLRKLEDAAHDSTQAFDAAAQSADASGMIRAYNEAAKNHDRGKMDYAAKLIAGSTELQRALILSGDVIEGGVEDFVKKIQKFGGDKAMLDALTAARKHVETAGAKVNMYGGQTFNLKQDFRDQDPDRVAIVFRQDIMRAAFSRTGTSSPFGI